MEGANDVHVDHCIFYQCKNAILLFYSAKGFSLTNSIIYGAYESAIWFGVLKEADVPFTFSNNIVSNSEYFWLTTRNEDHPLFIFNNSVITDNKHYMGVYDSGQGPAPFKVNGTHKENRIQKTGKVILTKVTFMSIPRNYLYPSPSSAGYSLRAGLFKTRTSN